MPEQNSFTGLLDELAIFGDELSEEQRRLLFHNGEGLYYDPVTTMWRSLQAEDLVVQEGVAQREALVPMGQNHMMLSADPAILLCQYVWGGRPGHRDELICRDGNPESESWLPRYYCLMDYYDPTSIVNTSGVVQERYRFSAFGNRTVMAADFSKRVSSEYAWNFAYKGQFRDDETGYYNYGYRYYAPEIGRWLSRDPIGERGGYNLYQLAKNNSLNNLDYLGLEIVYRLNSTTHDQMPIAASGSTKHIINWEGIDEIKESCDKLSAWIVKAKKILLEVQVDIASDGFGYYYTASGYQAIVEHEARRRDARYRGHSEYLLPISENAHQALKCGKITRSQAGQARAELQLFLIVQREIARREFENYVASQDARVEMENNPANWKTVEVVTDKGPRTLLHGYIETANVMDPSNEPQWKSCP